MTEERAPVELLRHVEADLRPVRPLATPTRRSLLLLPVGVLLLVGVPAVWGFRADLSLLHPAMAWGLSALQTLVALMMAGAALREAVPGRALSGRAVALLVSIAALTVISITFVTLAAVPAISQKGAWLSLVLECGGVASLSALPALAMLAWLVSRALPPRPALTGAIYGLGAGLLADSGVRLYCWISEPSHVLVAHGGAIVLMMGLGALLSVSIEAIRARGRR